MGWIDDIRNFMDRPGIKSGINQGIQRIRKESNDKFDKYLDKAVNYVETEALPMINESRKLMASELRVARELKEFGVDRHVVKALAAKGKGALADFWTSIQNTNAKARLEGLGVKKTITADHINNSLTGANLFKNENETINDYLTKIYLPNIVNGASETSAFDISGVRGRVYDELEDYAGTVLADGTSLSYRDLYTMTKAGSYTGFNVLDETSRSRLDYGQLYKGFADEPIKILTERYEETIGSEVIDMIRYHKRAKRKDDWDGSLVTLTSTPLQIATSELITQSQEEPDEWFETWLNARSRSGRAGYDANVLLLTQLQALITTNKEQNPFSSKAVAEAWYTAIGQHTGYKGKIYFREGNEVQFMVIE